MNTYKTKHLEIEAIQYKLDENLYDVIDFVDANMVYNNIHSAYYVKTLIGTVSLERNDFIVKLPQGFYVIKPEYFLAIFEKETTNDTINHPAHYTTGGVECIEAIKSATGEGYKAYLQGNIMKYLWRYEYKDGAEDLKKAKVYLNWLIEEMEDMSI